MVSVWELIAWGMWVALYGGIGAVIAAVLAKVLGWESAPRLFVGGVSAVAVGSFGWFLITSSAPAPGGGLDWVYLAMAGALMAVAGIYLAMGRLEEGGKHVLYAFLVVGLIAFAAAVGEGGVGPAGDLRVGLSLTETTLNSGEELGLTITVPGTASYPVQVSVSWGDNTSASTVVGVGGSATLTHIYVIADKAAQAFTITAHAIDSAGREGFNTVTVMVQNPGYCPYPWYLGFLCPLVSGVRWVVPGLDLVKLVSSPEFPTSEGDPIYEVYEAVLAVSLSVLGLYLALGLVFGAFEGGVVEVFKDCVTALILALIIPWVYNASVGVMNWVALSMTPWVDPLAPAAGIIATGLAIGYFVPAAANLASALIIIMMILSAVVVIRYVLILALIAGFPLVAVASIHPLFRGVLKHVMNLLAGLVIAGPLVAIFLRVLTVVTPGGELTLSITYPVVGVIVPNILSLFGAGVLGGVGEAVMGGVKKLAGGAVAGTTAGTVASKVVRVQAPATLTAGTSLKPVITPAAIKTSVREARLAKEVSDRASVAAGVRTLIEGAEAERRAGEALREAGLELSTLKTLPPQVVETLKAGVEPAGQATREIRVEPTKEAFKTLVSTLATQAWSQLRTNAKTFTVQLSQNLTQELGTRMPRTEARTKDSYVGENPVVSKKVYVRV